MSFIIKVLGDIQRINYHYC